MNIYVYVVAVRWNHSDDAPPDVQAFVYREDAERWCGERGVSYTAITQVQVPDPVGH